MVVVEAAGTGPDAVIIAEATSNVRVSAALATAAYHRARYLAFVDLETGAVPSTTTESQFQAAVCTTSPLEGSFASDDQMDRLTGWHRGDYLGDGPGQASDAGVAPRVVEARLYPEN